MHCIIKNKTFFCFIGGIQHFFNSKLSWGHVSYHKKNVCLIGSVVLTNIEYKPRKTCYIVNVQVKGFVLRILAHEIYTWKGKVTSELSKVSSAQ